ncbi:MAG: LysR family transcriptional regulator [Lachnospiraceae bacterium]|nr:LysR family transcriptional regulator [Lachnospiraceae bacterium]
MELKQLQYFVICAETQSFRKASSLLFTTQSNVSKVIKSLEEELGQPLFRRSQTGVMLTEKGKQIYEYAAATLDSADRILNCSGQTSKTELKILTNPSSWMANAFCRYYKEYGSASTNYTFLSSNTHDIINSLTAETASLAFIYVMEQQLPFLERQLSSNHLSFSPLKKLSAVLYLGAEYNKEENQQALSSAISQDGPDSEPEEEEIALIQGYEDEFTLRSFWNSTKLYDKSPHRFRVAVTTNSDYLMNEMLNNTSLGNISSGYISKEEYSLHRPAVSLYGDEKPVVFGCVFRNDRTLNAETMHFLKYIRKEISAE